MTHEKQQRVEKIVITSTFFESENIEKSVKNYIRKLANNYKL